jgi:predicted O-linked N-acetylglucosamine transferase (SPINDLY family)
MKGTVDSIVSRLRALNRSGPPDEIPAGGPEQNAGRSEPGQPNEAGKKDVTQTQQQDRKDLNIDLYLGRGQQRLQDGHTDHAVEDLATAIELAPDNGIALGLAAVTATRAGQPVLQQKVIDRYRAASKQLLFDLGEVGKWYSRPPEASGDAGPHVNELRAAFNAFIEKLTPVLEPDRERLFWLGEGLYSATLASVAAKVLARHNSKYPGHLDAEAMLIDAIILTCDFEGRDRLWAQERARLERQLQTGETISIDPFNLHLMGADFNFVSRVCRRRSQDFMPADVSDVGWKPTPSRVGAARIKVAFVLPYSWYASCSLMVNVLLPEFDRSRFEIFGYSMKTNPIERADEFDKAYRKRFDRFVSLDGLSPKAAAAIIAADQIDIAIDVSGHNRTTCLPIMAYRPAPIQLHHIGWSSLMEAPYMDYVVNDPHYHPKYLQDMTTENFALMPEASFIYYQPASAAPTGDPGPHPGPFRFCNFNHPGKFDTQSFAAWTDILRGTEGSVLIQCHYNLGDSVRNMRAYAERAGIDPRRLVFVSPLPFEQHMQRLQTMDLALDTLRLGGGATTLDAFWVGLPVVACCTHADRLHASRGAFGPLSLNDEVHHDVESYVRRAIELRNDPRSLAVFRQRIAAARANSLMFDPRRYTVEFERLLEAMWARQLRGERPATFMLQ